MKELLAKIRQIPALYLRNTSLSLLWAFIEGYYAACKEGNITPDIHPHFFYEFRDWLNVKYGMESRDSWSNIILARSANEGEAFDLFFKLLDEYQAMQTKG